MNVDERFDSFYFNDDAIVYDRVKSIANVSWTPS
jgi:hypothetical protein